LLDSLLQEIFVFHVYWNIFNSFEKKKNINLEEF